MLMNKKLKFFLIFYGIFIFTMVAIQLILDDAVIHWEIFIIIIILIFATSIYNIFIYKKIDKLISKNEYDLVLYKSQKMFRFKIIPKLNFTDQVLSLKVAVLCLQNKDKENFEKYISKVNHSKLKAIKYYWLTIAEIVDNNMLHAKQNYQKFLESPKQIPKYLSFEVLDTILSGIIAYYDGDLNKSKEKLTSIYDKLTIKIIKEICEEIIEKIDYNGDKRLQ